MIKLHGLHTKLFFHFSTGNKGVVAWSKNQKRLNIAPSI